MNEPIPQHAIRMISFLVNFIDFKIENPFDSNIPEGLEVKIGYSNLYNEDDTTHFTVNLELILNSPDNTFMLQVKSMALFQTQSPIDEAFKNSSFVSVNAPAIAFPFLRSFITTLTSNAGVKPVILPAFNFNQSQ
ncbi:MAG: protein-export chaperone SecB [Bacteroidales bacterium]|nr:protein-export chaperone SecB [Bacteroidales bacterium]